MTVISQFNGIYYTIDDGNIYHRGNLFWLSQALPILGIFINVCIVLFYRKVFERKFLFFFLAYMILPVTALCLAMLYYGITFINIATTLSALILYIGVQIDHSNNMKLQISIMDNHIKSQEEHYKSIQTYIAETKRAEHDLRHHIKVIQSYLTAGENDKLDEYLSKYAESLPSVTEASFCENFAVNSIMQYYISIAKKEDIHVDVNLEVPANTGISDSDMCIVFGNCIENAIEACRKQDRNRYIKVRSKLTGKMFTVIVINSFDGKMKKDGDSFLSLKREGEGVGISSIRAVVNKYGESAQFEADGNEFRAVIILRVP